MKSVNSLRMIWEPDNTPNTTSAGGIKSPMLVYEPLGREKSRFSTESGTLVVKEVAGDEHVWD